MEQAAQRRILVVDDDSAITRLLKGYLEGRGFSVADFGNGEEALRAALDEPPDLILLDIHMPGLDGFSVCQRLKHHSSTCDIPVVFLSGATDPEEKLRAFAVGGVDYISKPFSIEELHARLKTQFDLLSYQQELQERNVALEQLNRAAVRRENILRAVADFSSTLDYYLDIDGKLVFISPICEELTGYSQFRFYRQPELLSDIIHREDLHEWRAFRRLLKEVRRPPGVDLRVCGPNGVINWMHFTGAQVLDGGENVIGFSVSGSVITERVSIEQALRESELKLRHITDAATVMIWMSGPDKRCVYVSRPWIRFTGIKRSAATGFGRLHAIHPDDLEEYWIQFSSSFDKREAYTLEYRMQGVEGEYHWVMESGIPSHDDAGNFVGYIGSCLDISDRKAAEDRINHLAHYDALTNLPNRMLFVERCEHALIRAARSGKQVAILFIDLDNFKHINDSLGHPVGDALLKYVASRFREVVREEDTIARLGGDEFSLMLEDVVDPQESNVVARKILEALGAVFRIDDYELQVSASIGISLYPMDGDDVTALIRNADAAMYQSKALGKNTTRFYTRSLTERAMYRVQLETGFRKALNESGLAVYYQPQYDLGTGILSGAEALIRWPHPQRGMMLPCEFLPIAEDSGLMPQMGEWILREACFQAQAWLSGGVEISRISVNIAGQQLQRGSLIKTLHRILDESGLSPSRLELEITEDFLMQQAPRAVQALNEVRDLGVSIAIDDFGTGYSSLSYLKQLPIDKLKIDRSFVANIPHDSDDEAIARAILAMGHSLQLTVIAEGIENLTQAEHLKKLNCDQGQGFLYGEPMCASDFEQVFVQ